MAHGAGSVAKVTIAGLPVVGGGFGQHSWQFKLGTAAPEVAWRLPPYVAAVVLALKETEIVMEAPSGRTLKIERVVVVRELPSPDPMERIVVLSDIRWYWPRLHMRKLFNLRTQSGTRLLLQTAQGVPTPALPVTDEITFAPPSLKDDQTPWKAKEILADILTTMTAAYGGKFVDLSRARPSLITNDLKVDARSDIALVQALSRVGGVDVRVRPDSTVEIIDAYLGAEIPILQKAVPYSLWALGQLRIIDMSHVAPKSITVYYEREVEVRADGWEPEAVNTQTVAQNSEPFIEEVIKVSDLQLQVPGQRTAVQGEYLPVDTWLGAVEAVGDRLSLGSFPTPGPLTRKIACQKWFGPMLELLYVTFLQKEPDEVWAARIAAFRRDYRTLWRLNRNFSTRILPGSIRPVRAALINASNGLRAPSTVYLDYARRPSLRGLRVEITAGYNQNSIPGVPMSQKPGPVKIYDDPAFPFQVYPLNDAKIAPWGLNVEDATVGVFRIGPLRDPEGKTADYAPGLVQSLPVVSPAGVVLTKAPATWELAELTYTHRVTFIFSCVPLGPNNTDAALHAYEVSAAQALAKLGVPASAVNAQGPNFDMRVMPGLSRARCAWGDEVREQILSCFTGDGSGGQSLIPVNDDELMEYAQASAAVLMAPLLDHVEGQATIEFSPSLMPIGSMNSVSHGVDPNGNFYTSMNCAQAVPPIQPEHLLSPGARAILFGAIGQVP